FPALHDDPARHGGAALGRREAEHLPAAELSRPGPGGAGVSAHGAARRRDHALPPDRTRHGERRAPVHDPGPALAAGPGRSSRSRGAVSRTAMLAAGEGSGGRWRAMRAPRSVFPGLLLGLLLVWGAAPTVRAGETARQILDRRKALDDTTRKWTDRQEH